MTLTAVQMQQPYRSARPSNFGSDVPGLIFVLGWNLSALGRSAASAASDSSVRVLRDLIKKIVQLTYRLPVPNRQQIDRLIDCYAETSGTTEFLDNAALHTLAERTQQESPTDQANNKWLHCGANPGLQVG